MKIGFITDNYPFTGDAPQTPPGGIGTYTQLVAEELAVRGHEVHVITLASVSAPRCIQHQCVHIWQMPAWSKRREMGLISAIQFTFKYQNDARKLNQYAFLHGVWLAAQKKRFDIIESPEFAGVGAMIEVGKLTAKLAVRLHGAVHQDQPYTPNLDNDWFFQQEKLLYHKASVVTAASSAVLKQTYERWGKTSTPTTIVYNPAKPFISNVKNLIRQKNHTITYGRLDSRKGVDVLAKAAPKVFQKVADVRFHIIGKDIRWNDCLMGSEIIRQNSGPHGNELVEILPPQTNDSLAAYVNSCSLAIFPARAEAFGIAVIEAMLSGIPCIVSDIPPFCEITHDGKFAKLFRSGDDDDLAKVIIDDLKNPIEAAERAKMALLYAQKYLSKNIVALLLAAWMR